MAEVPTEPSSPRVSIILSEDVSKMRVQNKRCPVNTLPTEVLSRVFAIGDWLNRVEKSPLHRRPGTDIPALVSHVCSLWRRVAIGNATLWTSVCVTRSPHHLAFLYLARAGPTTLLDPYFDLRQGYWDSVGIATSDIKSQMAHIPQMMERFSDHDLDISPHRWQSLCICTARWEALVPFVSMINSTTASALKSLTWSAERTVEDPMAIQPAAGPRVSGHSRSLDVPSLPSLECLDFFGLPLSLISYLPSPTFPGLTHLSLASGCGCALFTPSRLGGFLAANPQLESLTISTGSAIQLDLPSITQAIRLPSLRSLTLRTLIHTHYLICTMHMIDAPELYRFVIRSAPSYLFNGDNDAVAAYIETGKIYQVGVSNLEPKPFYPSVRELDISSFSCKRARMTGMLANLPQITHLTVCGQQAVQLNENPSLLPNLVSLKFTRLVYPQLGDILRRRSNAGYPIKSVCVHKNYRLHVKDELPDTVEIQYYHDSQFRAQYEEVENEGDLEFEEDDGEYELDFLRELFEGEESDTGDDAGFE